MTQAPRRPTALPDELVEEILLRLPPSDPASLVRAALVCRRWCRLISDPGFARRFRELHRAPPMLGFLYKDDNALRFKTTSSFRPPYADFPALLHVVDARHGRILFFNARSMSPAGTFIVFNPITGVVQMLRMPQFEYDDFWATALLCAMPCCDHLDCPSGGPFRVVFVGTNMSHDKTSACVYSSEAATWSGTISVEHPKDIVLQGPSVLSRNVLYFACYDIARIMQYNLGNKKLSFISLPPGCTTNRGALMTTEDGGLGFVMLQDSKLYIWSREDGSDGYAGWAQQRVIELLSLLPARALSNLITVVASADGIGVVFMRRGNVFFTIDLKSVQLRKVCKGSHIHRIVPYMSFYTPALRVGSTGEEPR